jgi:deoxycytidylate deaminase
MTELLKGYELYGWKPDKGLSKDDNFMDLCMIITRSSKLKQGSMACILVNEVNENEELSHNAIISVSNNKPLYGECDSDIHAEIAAIGDACRNGISTNNATAYITMPPCKRCFAALTVAGIRKIVTRFDPPKKIQETAIRENIEFIKICNQAEQMTRINFLVNGDSEGKKRKNSSTDENYNHAKKVQNGKKNEN